MNKALLGAGGMVLTYLTFLLPLSRPGKNLVLGVICAAAALAMYQVARRQSANSANKVAAVALVTSLMLPLLAVNLLARLDVATLYIWAAYILLYAVVSVLWAKKYG